MKTLREDDWFGHTVPRGSCASAEVIVSQSFSGYDVKIPLHVWRGPIDGPTVSITAAVHGDEINGVGAIRRIIRDKPFELFAGTLVLVPVVNLLGFERHARYLPDRRDLNRSFPGSKHGSLTARYARAFYEAIVKRCEYGIDLHTAALRRTNFPNVRADLSDPRLAAFARAFGAELTIDSKGPPGSLRAAACKAGCATLILEAGEVWKVEPTMVEYTLHGIENSLRSLGMVAGEPLEPAYRLETDATQWIRAAYGGFLEFHVAPGDIVSKGDRIATNTSLVGDEQSSVVAPRDAVILGMTTIPSVGPGDPVCHLAYARRSKLRKAEKAVTQMEVGSLHERIRDDLASNVDVLDDPDLTTTPG
ncbi:succinylglutamate desuccinylase/aspartoacylase family protein [Botrimarina hoheduenensis]|uniref:Succinylglutamate desuccinylase / Aspartoacylase family protein n=1 Tax=Botrimarina hoheduenensis TaxID=2528000 RepID=A0A5C5VTH3_9BACT|nr:succinylglutamate desuccinylase/aspartoacylase family protein [Botrimarina hoheduenensis]TWT41413.1 Succinylglutamate desuccinylase / Aspartoacylase family protein [Botrimarina hoheduenensis]